jgi:protein TonB
MQTTVTHPGPPGQHRSLAIAALIAVLLHTLLLLGVRFEPLVNLEGQGGERELRVVIVRDPAPAEEPKRADRLAQVSQVRSEEQATPAQIAKTSEPETEPLSAPTPPQPPATTRSAMRLRLNAEADVSRQRPEPLSIGDEPAPQPRPEPEAFGEPHKKAVSAAQILASRGAEIARLTARLSEQSDAYAKRTRRRAISASTKEYKYAAYLEAWRRKVERIGNLNYPEEAKRKKLYGNLVLHVAVRADGSVERIRVVHPSGSEILDEAAVRIVELAAPFAPFPPDIRQETDVLDITRTWQFLSSNRLGWEH